VLTINRMRPSCASRERRPQNKPSIKCHPADSQADPATASIMNGLIRNIEYASNADVAYDTAAEFAVSSGFGYWRVSLDYCNDGHSTLTSRSTPSSTRSRSTVTSLDSGRFGGLEQRVRHRLMGRDAFERHYKGAEAVDWKVRVRRSVGARMEGEKSHCRMVKRRNSP